MELRHLKSEAREATKLLEDKKVLEVKVRRLFQLCGNLYDMQTSVMLGIRTLRLDCKAC